MLMCACLYHRLCDKSVGSLFFFFSCTVAVMINITGVTEGDILLWYVVLDAETSLHIVVVRSPLNI